MPAAASRRCSTPTWCWTRPDTAAGPRRLAALGYDRPGEERLTINLIYPTRQLRLRPGALAAKVGAPAGALAEGDRDLAR